MNIGLVTADFGSSAGGGVESVVAAQAEAHVQRGHRVRVLSGAHEPALLDSKLEILQVETVAGFELVRLLRRPEEGVGLHLARPRLCEAAASALADFDVVHVHHTHTLSDHLVRELSRDKPVILHLHDHFFTCPRFFRTAPAGHGPCPTGTELGGCASCVAPDLPATPLHELEDRLRQRREEMRAEIGAAAAVLVPSAGHGRSLARALGLEGWQARVQRPALRTEIASSPRCGVRAGPALPAPSPRPLPGVRGLPKDLVVLHCGRRSEEKGSLDLVRALASLPVSVRDRVLLLAPGGSVSSEFDRQLEREGHGLRLELGAPYEASELVALAARADLAAFPSRLPESYALVVDEALALGLPVWASESAIVRERASEPAVRFLPAGDPASWSRAFVRLLDDPAPLQRARAALSSMDRPAPGAEQVAAELESLFVDRLAARTLFAP